MSLRVKMLGLPRVVTDSGGVGLPHGKTSALLLYLAYKGAWVSRDELLYLFWPEAGESPARKNLRQLLSAAKRLPYAAGLDLERDRLRWGPPADVHLFKRAVSAGDWSRAAQLYGGALLQSFSAHAPEFESWLEGERVELHTAWRGAVLALAEELEAAGRFVQAADLLMGLRKADPLDEEALRRLMGSLHRAGQTERALEVYGAFRQLVEDEYGGEPEESTRRLEAALRGGVLPEPDTPQAVPAAKEVRGGARHNLRAPLTPLVGRDAEKAKLAEMLRDNLCRLVTLTGPGGVGKTRLAEEVAREVLGAFEHGVWCVQLAPVASPELLVPAIMDALGFPSYGEGEPRAQLLELLRDRELLLILDNVEHLLAGTGLVAEMLEAAPSLKVLTTSRERLRVPGEWIFDVGGLTYPLSLEDDPMDYPAVELFRQSARRLGAGVAAEDLPTVAHITRLVEGLPLALELAAAWLRLLPSAEIAEGLTRGLELLSATDHDADGQHKSIYAVFEHSWGLLSDVEQRVLSRLSVFREDFTKEAAAEVVDATVPILSALVDKSLLRSRAGRFDLHELVKQYVATKLTEAAEKETRTRHCTYYAAFLQEREHVVVNGGEGQITALREIDEVLGDMRAAWRWATETKNVAALEDALGTLLFFLDTRALFREGEEAFRLAADALGEGATFARLLSRRGWFNFRLNRLDACQDACKQGLEVLERLGQPPDNVALHTLGVLHTARGELARAQAFHERVLELATSQGDAALTAGALSSLGVIAAQRGCTGEAKARYKEGAALFRRIGDRMNLVAALINLGKACFVLGDLGAAEAAFGEGLEVATETGNTLAVAALHSALGALSFERGAFERAEAYHLQTLALVEGDLSRRLPPPRHADEPHAVQTLVDLGRTAHALDKHGAALSYFREALRAALEFKTVPAARAYALESIVGMAALLARRESREALALLAFSLEQPELPQSAREEAEGLRAKLERCCTVEVVSGARSRGSTLRFETILYQSKR